MPGPLILGFDTSAAHCAAVLLSGGRLLAERAEAMGKGQAERLFPMLEELLADAGTGWRDLSGLAVGTGPGNFTGVRIAVAAARGLALSLGVRAAGVDAFDAACFGLDGPCAVTVAAPRGQVWLRLPGQPSGEALLHDPATPLAALAGAGVVGPAADTIAAANGGVARAAIHPPAGAIARLGAARLAAAADLPRPAPLYLRPADAAPSRDAVPLLLP